MEVIQNYISVEGIAKGQLENIILEIIDLYGETGFVNEVDIYSNKTVEDNFLVLFQNNPDFDRFCYFVNYMYYPQEIEFNQRPVIKGFWNLELDKPKKIEGKSAIIYVAKNDQEYDNVSLVTDLHKNYIYDFGGKVKPENNPDFEFHNFPLTINHFNHSILLTPEPEQSEFVEQKRDKKGCVGLLTLCVILLITLCIY